MDTARFDTLARALAHNRSRRAVLPLLGGLLAPLLGLASLEAKKKKKKKATLCLDGQTIRASKKKKKKLLKVGATPGACTACTPTCAGKCDGSSDGCGGACTSCGAGALCDAGVCRPCTVTCDGDGVRCGLALQDALKQGGTVVACPGRYVGNFELSANVTLTGAGDGEDPAANTILDANETGGVVNVKVGAIATLQALRFTGGHQLNQGGGIFSLGGLTLTTCTVNSNFAPVGGGIYHESAESLVLTDCVILENEATFSGGGIYVGAGPVTITGSAIRGNSAEIGGGLKNEGTVTFDSTSSITGNTVTMLNGGGGIFTSDPGVVTLNGATVSGNTTPQCTGVVC